MDTRADDQKIEQVQSWLRDQFERDHQAGAVWPELVEKHKLQEDSVLYRAYMGGSVWFKAPPAKFNRFKHTALAKKPQATKTEWFKFKQVHGQGVFVRICPTMGDRTQFRVSGLYNKPVYTNSYQSSLRRCVLVMKNVHLYAMPYRLRSTFDERPKLPWER